MTIHHIDLLIRLHPRGLFDLAEGSAYRGDLEILGEALDIAWEQRDGLYLELFVGSIATLIARWEAEFNVLRTEGKTDAERVAAVLARLRMLPSFRRADLEDVLSTLCGFAVTVFAPFSFRCDEDTSVCDDSDDLVDGTFLFYVEFDAESARASGLTRAEVNHFISLIQPAHTFGQVRCSDFRCDDEWSVCDLDLLGES